MSKKPHRAEVAGDPPADGDEVEAATDRPPPERPATYREVFSVKEYRAVFAASALSWIGDYFAKVAIAVLIFQDTQRVSLSAAGFAISYLPWILGGPLLAALADRYSYRRVMIACDVVRMGLVATLAIPGLPLPALLALLLAASLLAPPAQSARSALIPVLLEGDKYVVGIAIQATAAQAAQVAGYAAGGLLSALVNPRAALLVDALTFGLSALIIAVGVRSRPPAMAAEHRSHLLRETGDGFRVVFGDPVMRPIAFVVFAAVAVVIVPQGLAAAWSEDLGGGAWRAGLLMASISLGYLVGTVVLGRLTRPDLRLRLIRPLALLMPLVLTIALLRPPFPLVIAICAAAGFANSVIMPLNGLFVQVLPHAYRARAFGIMQGGMQTLFAISVLVSGAIADRFSVSIVVGAWSAAGLVLTALALGAWPHKSVIDDEIAHVKALNQQQNTDQSPAAGADAATGGADQDAAAGGSPSTGPAAAGRNRKADSNKSQPARL